MEAFITVYTGEVFLFWRGLQPSVSIEDPEFAKQILSNKFGYVKPKLRPTLLPLTGNGLGMLNGLDWVRHRSILKPAFTMDKLKVMTKRMAACTIDMIDDWKNKALMADHQYMMIEMSEEFEKLSADVIAHVAFASSYVEAGEVFKAQKELQKQCIATVMDIDIPGSRFLPTPSNLQRWKLDNKVKNSLKCMVEGRIESFQSKEKLDRCYGDDMLGLMIEASKTAKKSLELNMGEIIDELREEVLRECGMGIPEADMLTKLKLVSMVLFETLTLYGPVLELDREASKDMKLGNLMFPKGVQITIQFLKIHRSKEYWGEDANEFNPLRLKNGVTHAAKHPSALLAFGLGPRACIGQNFAMLEAKVQASLSRWIILSRHCCGSLASCSNENDLESMQLCRVDCGDPLP
ncbi:unnamed protein product [Dovyalis caffra]|uniref:Cytochrome P450 n=1 Tax=Dovyalis caffra TaxID=77055 RepID=A0AAV1SCJ0_9ROSI|nr:unnamed protein product [Dovyalis caffra]